MNDDLRPEPGPILHADPPPPAASPLTVAPVVDSSAQVPSPPVILNQGPATAPSSHRTPPRYPGFASPPRRSATPLLLGSLAILVLLVAAAVFFFTRVDGRPVLAGGSLTATPAGLRYQNPTENIAFTAPSAWSKFPTSTAQIMVRGGGCSFGLLEQHTVLPLSRLADAEAKDLHRRHPEASPILAPRSVSGHNALAFSGSYTDADGSPMTQTYILIDRGSSVLTLIETSTDPACAVSFDQVEESLRI